MAIRSPLLKADGPAAIILIRILLGWVFVSEGIGRFLYPLEQGTGRFENSEYSSPTRYGAVRRHRRDRIFFLLIVGSGRWSLDRLIARNHYTPAQK